MSTEPLKALDSGSYGELSARPNPLGLVLTFIPRLAVILANVEKTAGEPLTRPQVEALRDRMPVAAMPIEVVKAADEERGYSDIDAAKVWEEWQILSAEIRMQRAKDAAP